MILIDDVLPNIDRVYEHAVSCDYGPMIGPDGARYENMSFDIPEWLADTVYERIFDLVGPVDPYVTFFRLNTRGTKIPHWAHTDSRLCDAMGLFYLSRNPPEGSGTAIVEHADSGLARHPETPEEYALWNRDHSDQTRWRIVDFGAMKYNRLALIPSHLLHAAMPAEGFGSSVLDGRLVLITFFKEGKLP